MELDFLFKFNSAFCGSQSLLSSEGKARLSSQHRLLLNKCLFKKKLYCVKTDKTVKKVMASLSSSIIRHYIQIPMVAEFSGVVRKIVSYFEKVVTHQVFSLLPYCAASIALRSKILCWTVSFRFGNVDKDCPILG